MVLNKISSIFKVLVILFSNSTVITLGRFEMDIIRRFVNDVSVVGVLLESCRLGEVTHEFFVVFGQNNAVSNVEGTHHIFGIL